MKDKNISSKIIIVLFVLALLILEVFLLFSYSPSENKKEKIQEKVIEIIDGDTFKTDSGNYVRLIGINAPEKTNSFYNESKKFLESLILNKTIELVADKDNRDNYGRLLRYAYLNSLLINSEIVKQGYAVPLFVSPNFEFKELIEKAREECLKEGIRLCKL